MEKKTPLYDSHVALGAKMVEFGGFLMPVQYPSGILAEHMAVREKAGLFDVSHMGELVFCGEDALANIQHLVTTDISKMQNGDMRYGMFCNDEGGVVDDLIVYRMEADDYLIVVNAGNRDKDAAWVEAHLSGHPGYHDAGNEFGQIAIQGPVSKEIMTKLCEESALPEKYYSFTKATLTWNGRSAETYVSRSGYTGSFGYEILCKTEDTVWLWDTLLEAGKDFGLIPCGLGARDTLRLEAAMPLYGHELTDNITPKMAGLPCKLDGKDFIGHDALVKLGAPEVKRVGLKGVGRGIVREHCDLYSAPDGEKIGWTSSGTFAPYLGCCVAMGYVPVEDAEVGKHVYADVRGRKVVHQCKGRVYLESLEGDIFNLKSAMSEYVALGRLLSEQGDSLELFADSKEDEALLLNFLGRLDEENRQLDK